MTNSRNFFCFLEKFINFNERPGLTQSWFSRIGDQRNSIIFLSNWDKFLKVNTISLCRIFIPITSFGRKTRNSPNPINNIQPQILNHKSYLNFRISRTTRYQRSINRKPCIFSVDNILNSPVSNTCLVRI